MCCFRHDRKKDGVIAFRVTSPDHGGDPEEEITPILSITVHACIAMGTGGEGLIAPSLRFACPPIPRCGMGDKADSSYFMET